MCRNQILDTGAEAIALCLDKISRLNLNQCQIGNKGINAISQNIKVLVKPVNRLLLFDSHVF